MADGLDDPRGEDSSVAGRTKPGKMEYEQLFGCCFECPVRRINVMKA